MATSDNFRPSATRVILSFLVSLPGKRLPKPTPISGGHINYGNKNWNCCKNRNTLKIQKHTQTHPERESYVKSKAKTEYLWTHHATRESENAPNEIVDVKKSGNGNGTKTNEPSPNSSVLLSPLYSILSPLYSVWVQPLHPLYNIFQLLPGSNVCWQIKQMAKVFSMRDR